MASALSAPDYAPSLVPVTPSRLGRLRRRPLHQTPSLSVVVVNYHLWEETGALVRQLMAAPSTQRGEIEVVVVDNHSPRHPLARRLRRWPGVSLRRWGRNRGFARAVNEGCRLSRGQWLLLLNPDISLPPDFVEKVVTLTERLAAEQPQAGIVGFQLRNTDGSRQLSSGPFPTLAQTLLRLALPRSRRKYHFLRARRRRQVPWVTGCCMLIRRTCYEQLGGLDRDYFLYYEDVDLCRRASEQGWSVLYEPKIRVIHHYPLHLRNVPAPLRLLTRHALLTYALKHWPRWQMRILAGVVQLEAWARVLWAKRTGDAGAAHQFTEMRAIARDFGRGSMRSAWQRLDHIVRGQERQRVA